MISCYGSEDLQVDHASPRLSRNLFRDLFLCVAAVSNQGR